MKTILLLASLCCFAVAANAAMVTWTVDVGFGDGGSATGSFVFNADAGTACSGGTSPCGQFSSVDIVTSGGSLPSETYTYVCGQDVPSCTGLSPDSTEVLFLESNATDQTGLPAIAFFFTVPGPVPPSGLSDTLETIDMSGVVGIVQEAICLNSSCSSPDTQDPYRVSDAGYVSSVVPEPSSAVLFGGGMALLGLATLVKRGRARHA